MFSFLFNHIIDSGTKERTQALYVPLMRVRATTIAVEKQETLHILSAYL